jgi:hypothetical protein
MTRPEQEASSVPEPLQHLSFTLTRADALAYEQLHRELRGWRLVLWYIWIGLAGAVVAMLPEDWVGEEGGWRFWGIAAACGLVQYGLAVLAMSLCRYWRAARRLPHPVAVEMRDEGDHLEWREAGVPVLVAPETISTVIVTAAHAFICIGSQVLILPARAFENRLDMAAFAEDLERRGGDA